MPSTTFADLQGPPISAAWLNDINKAAYTAIGNGTQVPSVPADVRTNLGLPGASGSTYIGHQVPTATGIRTLSAAIIDLAINVKAYGDINTGTGLTDDTTAILAGVTAAGVNGDLFFPPGTYNLNTNNTLTVGRMIFARGAMIIFTAGSNPIISAEIVAGNYQIFNVGKRVNACDCNAGSTALKSWTYGFEASDVGKAVYVRWGGAKTGALPGANYVQDRVPFSTTISAYADDNNVTLAAPLVSAIRQNYVFQATYANLNIGTVVIGNGTVTLAPAAGRVNVKWFGAVGDGVTDDAVNLEKAFMSVSRQYGGLTFYFPPGTYVLGRELTLDVQGTAITCDYHQATLFRKANVAVERMNMIKGVWRGRYGGGSGIGKASENWSWTATENVWLGDWAIMYDILVENLIINGNQANQPVIAPGTGYDSWDAGISMLYVGRGTYRGLMLVNHLRWGIALSTQSSNSFITGCYADTCNEGAYYAETSSDIRIVGNWSVNSPAAGWNMGAITNLTIAQGVIAGNVINGGNNGIYLRNATVGVNVVGNAIKGVVTNGIWTYDETNVGGATAPRFLSITGNTIDSAGVYAIRNSYSSDLMVKGNTINATGVAVYFNNSTRLNYDNQITGATTNYSDAGGNTIILRDDTGTYTPTIQGATTPGTATYSTQAGRWQRRGRLVTFDAVVTWSAATGTGNLQLVLPFASATTDNSNLSTNAYNMTYTGYAVSMVNGGAATATVWNINGGTPAQIAVPASGTLFISGSYEVN